LGLALFALLTYLHDTTTQPDYILLMGCIMALAAIKFGLQAFESCYDYHHYGGSSQDDPLITSVDV